MYDRAAAEMLTRAKAAYVSADGTRKRVSNHVCMVELTTEGSVRITEHRSSPYPIHNPKLRSF